ncbi:phage tail protein [Arcobacter sp. L]|uniref:phage tail protein n=1 Tax=Arcobacter sp. L TaxID=944547 RepID=UPI00022964FE|nr:phage tail protein [Arcobacter sp. L]BAK73755.1 phage tail fiber protein [Arcobacter sp. L]
MSQYRLIFTNIGLTKKQNAELNNNYIQIAKFAVGSGVITNLNPNMTGLLFEEYRADINNVDTKNGTTFFDLIIPSEIGGFWIKEVALFDIDGDCICIGTVPITYKVNQDEGSSKAVHIKVSTTSTNTENIVFNTDNSLVYATVSYVNSHKEDKSNPHNVTKAQIGLGNVANLAPKDLPLSDAAISALALKANSIDVNNSLALKLNYTDVKNSLTATDTNKPLSAAQGKILKGYIDQINTLLLSDTSNLDTLQEIVDFIELNRATLDTLGISNIAGLQTALNTKLNASAYTAADVLAKIKSVDGSGSGLDADTIDGCHSTVASTPNTVAVRDSAGDINARIFKSEYDTTNPSIGFIMTQVDTASNNYIRPSTPAQVVAALGAVTVASAQALHATDPLRISGNTLYLYKGSGAYDYVALPPNTGLGISQTWQAVTKTSGVTYTNSTGNPIQLNVWKSPASSGTLTITVAGVLVAQSYYQNYGNGGVVGLFASAVIPAGARYIISGHSVAVELR